MEEAGASGDDSPGRTLMPFLMSAQTKADSHSSHSSIQGSLLIRQVTLILALG